MSQNRRPKKIPKEEAQVMKGAINEACCRRIMPGSELDSKVQRKGKVIRKVAYSFFHSYTFDSHYHSNMIQ